MYGCTADIPERTVSLCSPMPEGRACATVFVADGKAYVFAGRDASGKALNDLWCYSPETDIWTDLGTTPLSPRVNATACVCGSEVYLGLGFNGRYGTDSAYMRDWWQFVPATNSWIRLADYPNSYTDRAASFASDGAVYAGYGFCWNYRRDMFRYDIPANRWDTVDTGASYKGYPVRSFGGCGAVCRGEIYFGTGYYRNSLDWWARLQCSQNDPATEVPEYEWKRCRTVPGRTRTLAACAATDSFIYLCGGTHFGGVNTTGEVLCDIVRYDPDTDTWKTVGVMPQRLMNHVCFAIGKTVYFGLGENENLQTTNALYKIEE